MAVGDITRCIIYGYNSGVEWQSVLHYETLTSFGSKDSELDGLYDALTEVLVYKQLTNDMLNFMNTQNVVVGLRLRSEDDPTVGKDYLLPVGDGVGTMSGDPLSRQLAVLFQKKTGKVGKSYNGRNYLPLLTESFVSSNDISPSVVSDMADWFATLTAIINVTLQFSFRLVVYSKLLGLAEAVTDTGCVTVTKTQRRRTS